MVYQGSTASDFLAILGIVCLIYLRFTQVDASEENIVEIVNIPEPHFYTIDIDPTYETISNWTWTRDKDASTAQVKVTYKSAAWNTILTIHPFNMTISSSVKEPILFSPDGIIREGSLPRYSGLHGSIFVRVGNERSVWFVFSDKETGAVCICPPLRFDYDGEEKRDPTHNYLFAIEKEQTIMWMNG